MDLKGVKRSLGSLALWGLASGMSTEVSKKRKEPEPEEWLRLDWQLHGEDAGLGGLYDFLPPPDPEKDKAEGCMAG